MPNDLGAAFTFKRTSSGAINVPAVLIRDDVSTTGDPLTLRVESERVTGRLLELRSGGQSRLTVDGYGRLSGIGFQENSASDGTVMSNVVSKATALFFGSVTAGSTVVKIMQIPGATKNGTPSISTGVSAGSENLVVWADCLADGEVRVYAKNTTASTITLSNRSVRVTLTYF